MDGSFFLGEDEGQQDEEEYYPPESEEDEGTNSSHSDDDSGHDSQGSSSDSYRSANSDAEESHHFDSDASFWQSLEEIGDYADEDEAEVHFSSYFYYFTRVYLQRNLGSS